MMTNDYSKEIEEYTNRINIINAEITELEKQKKSRICTMKGRTPQKCKSGSKSFRVTTKCMETKEKNEYFVSKHSFSYGAGNRT